MTVIHNCTCQNTYQDKRYGKNNRVMNKMTKAGKEHMATCTSCGKEVSVYEATKKKT